jgi:N-acetylglucosaminyldiphosphoundecaprenol N-acetyl-beta-D-mannosaminyltransferase
VSADPALEFGPAPKPLTYPDLDRNVHAMLGLVFDAVTLEQATSHLKACALQGRRCIFSTPNVNFVIAALRDPDFRNSVLQSDLSLADGAPVVWIAKLLGVPLPERVAGSDVFERLRRMKDGRPLKVFFFGGAPGVASRAAQVLNSEISGLKCAGFICPGFGSVQEMSRPEFLNQINASGADFLVVSLGAKKGQRWIQANRDRIKVPLISHLGAVVNFVAGTVTRCPPWISRLGGEWLWRIKEEPGLCLRYANDGWALLKEIPSLLSAAKRRLLPLGQRTGRVEMSRAPSELLVTMTGNLQASEIPPIRSAVDEALAAGQSVRFDLSGLESLDSAALGFISLVVARQPEEQTLLTSCGFRPSLERTLSTQGLLPRLQPDSS